MRIFKLIKKQTCKELHACDAICRAEEARARFDRDILPMAPPRF